MTSAEPGPADVGRAVEILPGVRRLLAPNPGLMTGAGTNTYLVGRDPVVVIDPGPDDDAHLAAILGAGGDRIGWVVATHTHADHSPLVRRLAELTDARVAGYGPAPAPVPDPTGVDAQDHTFDPDVRMADGDLLPAGRSALRAVHTPGHASNHLCFELVGTGLLFTGDHVMSGSTVVIAPPDGDMAEYMASLRRVRSMGFHHLAPGHGALMGDPAGVLDGYMAHRLERERQIVAGLAAAGPAGIGVDALVEGIYAGVPPELRKVARFSVWAHLLKLAEEGRAGAGDPAGIGSAWRALG